MLTSCVIFRQTPFSDSCFFSFLLRIYVDDDVFFSAMIHHEYESIVNVNDLHNVDNIHVSLLKYSPTFFTCILFIEIVFELFILINMVSSALSTTDTKWYTVRQLKIFQFCLGLYLTIHFAQLIPHVTELFGRDGMIADPQWSPTYGYFPNLVHLIDYSSTYLKMFLTVLTFLSALFALRLVAPRLIAFVLWYGWACLLNRNVLISNPGIPYVGLLLLAFTLITFTKKQKPNGDDEDDDELELCPQVFPWLYWGSWTLVAVGYTISGLHKLQSPSWLDGSALRHVLQSPLSRDNFLCHFLLNSNPFILQLSTWASLFAEISFLPLGIFYHTRQLYWFAFLALHLGVLLVVNFTDLTFGVLAMHFFLFDPRWLFSVKPSSSSTKLE